MVEYRGAGFNEYGFKYGGVGEMALQSLLWPVPYFIYAKSPYHLLPLNNNVLLSIMQRESQYLY